MANILCTPPDACNISQLFSQLISQLISQYAPRIEALQRTLLESSCDPTTRARLLTVATKESGAWLNALPVASLGLRLDNEVVRVAVGLHLGLPLCCPHQCTHCEAEVNDRGTHGPSSHFSKGHHSRHGAVNDVVKRLLEAAKITAHLELTDIYRSDGKRPDGASVVPWRGGGCWFGTSHALIPWRHLFQ